MKSIELLKLNEMKMELDKKNTVIIGIEVDLVLFLIHFPLTFNKVILKTIACGVKIFIANNL